MPVEAQLGFDFPYNEKLRERNRLLSQMDVITHNPQLLGGGRLREKALPGQNGAYPLDRVRLMELQSMGGAFNLTKFLRPTVRALNSKQGQSIVKPLTAAAVNMAVRKMGGKVNRFKKATKWTKYAADTLNTGLDLASKGKNIFGMGELENVAVKVRRVKKVLAEPIVQEIIKAVRKAPVVKQVVKKVKAVVGGAKPRGVRAAIVKKVMKEQGLGMIAASKYVKAKGLY